MSPFTRLGARVDQLAAEVAAKDAPSGWSNTAATVAGEQPSVRH
ncbi:hypothetical protein ACU610_01515 [Geodermatophilus sp. URMC 61]